MGKTWPKRGGKKGPKKPPKTYFLGWMLAVVALMATCTLQPAFAQEATTPAPAPVWTHGDDETILDVSFRRDELTDKWAGKLDVAWLHFVSDATELGAVAGYLNDPGTDLEGETVGGRYEFNLPGFRNGSPGHFFLGGDLRYLLGGLDPYALAVAATRIGYKIHVGDSSAVRLALDFAKPVDPADQESADGLSQIGFTVGLSFGVKPGTTVK